MSVPKKVREQAERAEQLAKEHGLTEPPAESTPEHPLQAVPAQQTPAAAAPKGNPDEDWEKRYKGLKRTHDTEMPKLRTRIAQLEAELAKAQQAPPAPAAAPAPKPVSTEDVLAALSDKEKAEYSPEFLDLVVRIAGRVASNSTAVDNTVTERLDRIERTAAKTAEDIFWDEIDRSVPSWQEMQATEDMQGWLLEYDDLLGMSRSQAVAEAQQNLDSRRVIAIYNQYKQTLSGRSIDNTPEGELQLPESGGAGGDGGVPPNRDTTQWTVSQVQRFYRDVALGKYKGKEGRAKADAIEKQIEKARDDGRIIEG